MLAGCTIGSLNRRLLDYGHSLFSTSEFSCSLKKTGLAKTVAGSAPQKRFARSLLAALSRLASSMFAFAFSVSVHILRAWNFLVFTEFMSG